MSDWQPIETAPKDGKSVLLYIDPPIDTNDICGWAPEREIRIVVGWAESWGERAGRDRHYWHCGFCEDGTADTEGYSSALMISVRPTHWMPLPGPPQ